MYSVSAEYTAAVQATERNMQNISVVVGGNTYNGRAVRGLTLHESVSENSDRLLPGCAACASLRTTVVDTLSEGLVGSELRAYHTLNGETVPLGVFVVQEVNARPGTSITDIVAYDRMSLLDGEDFVHRSDSSGIDPSKIWPTFKSLLDAIVPLDNSGTVQWATVPAISDACAVNRPMNELHAYTCKELLGYIAGAHGAFARFNRSGLLEFVWYQETGVTIPLKAIYMDGLQLESANDVTDKIIIYSNDDIEVAGFSVYTNDLISPEYVTTITHVNTASCSRGELKYRGDPSLQAGDVVTVTLRNGGTRKFAFSEHTLTFAGGLMGEASCHQLSGSSFHQLNGTQREIARLKKNYANLKTEEAEVTTYGL